MFPRRPLPISPFAAGTAVLAFFLGLAVLPTPAPGAPARKEAAIKPPLGLPPIPWPEDNPYTPEKAELGRLLYFDKRLSSKATVSCASCHTPDRAFGDGAAVATGIDNHR
jgi:cytochrome c peroxidase